METTSITSETDRYLNVSQKVEDKDLDWNEARRIGLTTEERMIITYFSDIENQTIVYLRDFLHTKAALEPDIIAFLSMWNYEEFFHGRLLSRLLSECGHALEENRVELLRKSASITEIIESFLANLISKIFYAEFPAVYMAWGAVQEMTTLRSYEELIEIAQNPVLKIIATRIAKQERRHYAWYFNNANKRLQTSTKTQKLCRFLLSRFWSPVGAGVKSPQQVAELFYTLFKGSRANEVGREIDNKIATLPGMDGLQLFKNYTSKIKTMAEKESWQTPFEITTFTTGS